MKVVFLSAAVLLFSFMATAKSVECADLEEPGFKLTANFDSTKPSLTSSVIKYKPDGSIEHESKTEYLSPNAACDTNANFSADCTAQEREGSMGYSFNFNCKAKKLSGEFYVDETGNGNFSCSNAPGSSVFFGCTIK